MTIVRSASPDNMVRQAFGTPSMFGDAGWRWYNLSRLRLARFVQGGLAINFRWQTESMSLRRLIYFGTEDEMQLGDHILVRRGLRPDVSATVTYIPGQSPPEPALTDYQFGYETEDGKLRCTDFDWLDGLSWSVAPKGIQLVCRSGADVEAAIKSLEAPEHQ